MLACFRVGLLIAMALPMALGCDGSDVTGDAGELDGGSRDSGLDAAAAPCSARTACGLPERTCVSETERCVCPPSTLGACEPLACAGNVGEPCSQAGLDCAAIFERPARRCVGPELVWVGCGWSSAFDAGVSSCPSAPSEGSPCCGGQPGCEYGGVVYQCVDDHWQRSEE
jgi:hypothetical protein